MKKILMINTTFFEGGAAKMAHLLNDSLNSISSFSSYFAYGRGKLLKDQKTFRFTFYPEIYLHFFLVRFFGLEGFGNYFSTKRLINYIEKNNFDLIHFHNLHGYYLNIWQLLRYLSLKKIPIVWTLHDEWVLTWLPAYSMGCSHCKTLSGGCINFYSYPKTYNKLFSRFLLKTKQKYILDIKNLTFVCPSIWLKNQIEDSYLREKEIRVIYNGVDTKIFRKSDQLKENLRKKYNLPLDKKILLFYSNLKDERKGTNFVLELAYLFNKQKKDILFLGFGPTEIKNLKNVRTLGFIKDQEKLKEIYSLSDLLIFPSLAETFSFVVVESIMTGLPVIVFDIGPFSEIVGDNKYGILIKEINLESLNKGVDRALSELSCFKDLPDENFIKKFSLERMTEEYINLYNEKLR